MILINQFLFHQTCYGSLYEVIQINCITEHLSRKWNNGRIHEPLDTMHSWSQHIPSMNHPCEFHT